MRTRSDANPTQTNPNLFADRDQAIASGAQFVSTDYPVPDPLREAEHPERTTPYFVQMPGGTPGALQPDLRRRETCTASDIEDPAWLGPEPPTTTTTTTTTPGTPSRRPARDPPPRRSPASAPATAVRRPRRPGRLMADALEGKTIIVTGPTGQVGAAGHPGAGRATTPSSASPASATRAERERLEADGVTCIPVNLADGDFSAVPRRRRLRHQPRRREVRAVGGRPARQRRGGRPAHGPLPRRHRRSCTARRPACTSPPATTSCARPTRSATTTAAIMPTYSIAKIAAEAVVRTTARQLDLPTTIARLNVPYGDNGGWPNWHLECILADLPDRPCTPTTRTSSTRSTRTTSSPASPRCSTPRRCRPPSSTGAATSRWRWSSGAAHLGALVGREPRFHETEAAIGGVTVDLTRMHELVGPTTVDWRDGLRRMVAARHPELLVTERRP